MQMTGNPQNQAGGNKAAAVKKTDWFSVIMSLLMLTGSIMCIYVLILFIQWKFFFWQLLFWPVICMAVSLGLAVYFLQNITAEETDKTTRGSIEIYHDSIVISGDKDRSKKVIHFNELKGFRATAHKLFIYTRNKSSAVELDRNLLTPDGEKILKNALQEAVQKISFSKNKQ